MAVSARFENLASWFAASVLVTAGVIYALKLEDDRPDGWCCVLAWSHAPARARIRIDSAGLLRGRYRDIQS
jgi:hypothetical protein